MAKCETHGHLRGVGDRCMFCNRAMEPLRMSGSQMIDNERTRQIESEGWTAAHDDEHTECQLLDAAICYAGMSGSLVMDPDSGSEARIGLMEVWPWEPSWWKPSNDPIRNLVKAGALIAAEIDRMQRKSEADKS